MPDTTTKVRFFCFYCYEPVSAPAKFVGKKGQCPRCGKLTKIPPTSTRAPNRAGLAKNVGDEGDEFVIAAEKEGATVAPTETGALPAIRRVSTITAAADDGTHEDGTQRQSSNGAPATGPAGPRPVIDHQKIEVWKEVFRGKPAAPNGRAPSDKSKS